jgi:hypothetical protein
MTTEIKDILNEMISDVKNNKKVTKKEKTPRFSGYHLFMKEHRATVKLEQPDIKPQMLTTVVSKAWKDISEDKKKDFNDRAAQNKDDYNNKESDKESDKESKKESEKKVRVKNEKKEKKEKKEKVVKPKKEKVVKPKKVTTPPTSDDDDDEITIVIEDVESDIDI